MESDINTVELPFDVRVSVDYLRPVLSELRFTRGESLCETGVIRRERIEKLLGIRHRVFSLMSLGRIRQRALLLQRGFPTRRD